MRPARKSSRARVRVPRLADVLADQIRDEILSGELGDGERLPPVDTLVEQFGVSAPSVREALRVLEAEGLIVVQRGGIGGAVVRRPTARNVAYALALVLRSQGVRTKDVSEAITLLQPLCVMRCAQRADRKSKVVKELRKLNQAAHALLDTDEVLFNDTMLEFHRSLVRLAGNDALALVTNALEHIRFTDVRDWVASTAAHGRYPSVEQRRAEIDFHERITDLVEAGDGLAAAALMREHLEHTAYLDVVYPDERVDPKSVRLGS